MATGLYSFIKLRTPRTIRLLTLDPYDLSDTDSLSGKIHVADLDSSPTFDALSYVWGSASTPSRKIVCNGIDLELTDNCYKALVHLRRSVRSLTIWIDAVCIDQDNEAEKQHQLPLMEAIYGDARHVYIWLGEGSKSTSSALRKLSKPPLLKSFNRFRWSSTRLKHKITTIWLYRKSFRRFWNIQSWTDLEKLLNEWITGVWTFQEIMLATQPILVLGDCHLDWTMFALSLICLDCKFMNDRHERVESLQKWLDIVLVRDCLYQDLPQGTSLETLEMGEHMGPLKRYHRHLWETRAYYDPSYRASIWFATKAIALCSALCLILFVLAVTQPLIKIIYEQASIMMSMFVILMVLFVALVSCVYRLWEFRTEKCLQLERDSQSHSIRSLHYAPTRHALSAAFMRQATDPRDKFFGMRSILERIGCYSIPDIGTTCTYLEAFKALAATLINTEGGMDVVRVALQNQMRVGPSWVPDWEVVPQSYEILHDVTPQPSNRAPRIRIDGNTLFVQGIILRRIVHAATFQFTNTSYHESENENHWLNVLLMSRLVKHVNRAAKFDCSVHSEASSAKGYIHLSSV